MRVLSASALSGVADGSLCNCNAVVENALWTYAALICVFSWSQTCKASLDMRATHLPLGAAGLARQP